MDGASWITASASAVLFGGTYLWMAPYLKKRKTEKALNAPSEPRIFALGCALLIAVMPWAVSDLWGKYFVAKQHLTPEPIQIILLGQPHGSGQVSPWTDKEKQRSRFEAVVLVKHFDALFKDAQRTGDLGPIQHDEVIKKTVDAYALFQERGEDSGDARPCYMALMLYANMALDLMTNRGAGLGGDEYRWMLENCTRCEQLLK